MSINELPQILKITKTNLNGLEVNSVNSREVYEHLEIVSNYSTWFNRAVEKYDFIENEDYIRIITDSKSGKCDFIVSMDMAKELCMVSNTSKGKETRKYFISIENKAVAAITELDLIIQSAQEMKTIKATQNQQEKRIELLEDSKVINSRQKHALKQAVTLKVFELIHNHNLGDDFIKKGYQRVWKKLKDKYLVSSYMEIPMIKYEDSLSIVRNISVGDLI